MVTSPGLSARSVVASTLLGTVPPRLPGRLLVAFAEEFGIRPGTTRTALSRMVDRDEVRYADGSYELAGTLLDRHHRQQAGLEGPTRQWDGSWEIVVVPSGARPSTDRAALRRACTHLGLWERRDGVWLRPANLDPDRLPSERAIVAAQGERWIGRPDDDPRTLVAELVDLGTWSRHSTRLIEVLHEETESLATGFVLAADALRHLVTDPHLPAEVAPADWPAPRLRAAYATYSERYRALLGAFFRSRSAR